MVRPGKTVLVTGGAGYVGSHVCKSLAEDGFDPVTVDCLSQGHESSVRWGPLEVVDLTDGSRLGEVFARHRPAGVVHCAALCNVSESVSSPARYYHNNVAGSLNLLQCMVDQGVKPIIHASSCAVYGVPESVPISEKHPCAPITPYGTTKRMVEDALRDFSLAYGMRFVSLRCFNVAGADPDGEIGEDHDPEFHLIPLVIETALGRRRSFEIYGTDHATPDGTAVRDYVHVSDLARAVKLALHHLLGGGHSVSLNLGTGRGHSVKEVIASVERLSGVPVPVTATSRRPGDPSILIADASEACRVLAWRPTYRCLDDVVATGLTWHRRKPFSSPA